MEPKRKVFHPEFLTTEEPRKSRAYHISQDAVDICNRLEMDPSDALVYLSSELEKRAVFVDVKAAMREVMQVEGVTLRDGDKRMLERAFNQVISEIQKKHYAPKSVRGGS